MWRRGGGWEEGWGDDAAVLKTRTHQQRVVGKNKTKKNRVIRPISLISLISGDRAKIKQVKNQKN